MKQLLLAAGLTLMLPLLAQAQEPAPAPADSSAAPAEQPAPDAAPAESAATPAQDDAAVPVDAAAEPAPAADTTGSDAQRDSIAHDMQGDAPAAPEAPATDVGTIDIPPPPAAGVPSSGGSGDDTAHLDDITVTAQKTKQSARRVPVSITAIDGAAIKQTGAASLADISVRIPNVRVDAHDPGSPQVFIRGFGTNAFNPSFESSVAFVQDDIYFGRPGYFTESMFDIERVEVLRGPQGTLFGKNTIAGVFNVISKGPEGDPAADGSYYYGDHGEQRIEAGAGGMLNDWFGARIAGYYQTRDGQLQNTEHDRKEDALRQRAGRLKLRFLPTLGMNSELTVSSSQTNAPFWPFQLDQLDSDTRSYLKGFDPKVEDDPTNFQTSFETQGYIAKGSDTASLKTEWDLGDVGGIHEFTPVLVLGMSRFHIDQLNELDVSPADIARLDSHERHRQTSAELRFTGHADSLFGLGDEVEFVGGGFYFNSKYSLFARILGGQDLPSYILTKDACQLLLSGANVPYGACDALSITQILSPANPILGLVGAPLLDGDFYQFDYGQEITSKAAFGQATWNINEQFAVTPGVRFSWEDKKVGTQGAGNALTGVSLTEQLISAKDYDHQGLSRSEFDVAPKLALQWFAPSGINYYASYAAGYKSGGFNAISLTGDKLEYEPEQAQTMELGGKAKLLDRTLAVNMTLYYTRFSNLQVLAFNGLFFDVSNAGKAKSQGMEADFSWITPYEPLRISGAMGLLDAHYLDYPGAPSPVHPDTLADNTQVCRGGSAPQGGLCIGAKQNLAGQRIAFAPSSTATLSPSLTYPIGSLLATFAADMIWQGDQFTDTDLDPNTHVGGNTKYSAHFILADSTELWAFSIGGNNLTDKRTLNQVIDATFFPGSYFAQQAAGRTLFATLSFKL